MNNHCYADGSTAATPRTRLRTGMRLTTTNAPEGVALPTDRSIAQHNIARRSMAVNTRGPTYKVVLLGELGVGKTALFRRLKDNTFDEFSTATAGIDSCTKVTKVDGETITLSIWDTAGVERFRTLTRNYYRNAHAAVFVYSVTDISSLHYLSQWEKDTQNFAPNAVRMLLGNKIDLEPEVDEFAAKSFARTHEFELDNMISCKTNQGVKDAFDALARALQQGSKNSEANSIVQLGNNYDANASNQGGSGCAC